MLLVDPEVKFLVLPQRLQPAIEFRERMPIRCDARSVEQEVSHNARDGLLNSVVTLKSGQIFRSQHPDTKTCRKLPGCRRHVASSHHVGIVGCKEVSNPPNPEHPLGGPLGTRLAVSNHRLNAQIGGDLDAKYIQVRKCFVLWLRPRIPAASLARYKGAPGHVHLRAESHLPEQPTAFSLEVKVLFGHSAVLPINASIAFSYCFEFKRSSLRLL